MYNGANFIWGWNYYFVQDRFCSQNKAIYLQISSYLQIPSGVYFSGDFTITIWLYLKSYGINDLIFLEFFSYNSSSILLKMFANTSQITLTVINSNIVSNLTAPNSSVIALNQWYHIAATLQNTTASLYVNGMLVKNGACFIPYSVNRTANYIGVSANAIIDDFKIYKGTLTANDVLNDYTIGSYGNIINDCSATSFTTTTTTTTYLFGLLKKKFLFE